MSVANPILIVVTLSHCLSMSAGIPLSLTRLLHLPPTCSRKSSLFASHPINIPYANHKHHLVGQDSLKKSAGPFSPSIKPFRLNSLLALLRRRESPLVGGYRSVYFPGISSPQKIPAWRSACAWTCILRTRKTTHLQASRGV